MLIQGSVNAVGFEQWLDQWLCKELRPNSTLIMDNAPIHRQKRIEEIAEARGHQALFLPRYSPDFNSIEHDFAAMKKNRKYALEGTSIAQIVKDYSERDISSKLI